MTFASYMACQPPGAAWRSAANSYCTLINYHEIRVPSFQVAASIKLCPPFFHDFNESHMPLQYHCTAEINLWEKKRQMDSKYISTHALSSKTEKKKHGATKYWIFEHFRLGMREKKFKKASVLLTHIYIHFIATGLVKVTVSKISSLQASLPHMSSFIWYHGCCCQVIKTFSKIWMCSRWEEIKLVDLHLTWPITKRLACHYQRDGTWSGNGLYLYNTITKCTATTLWVYI